MRYGAIDGGREDGKAGADAPGPFISGIEGAHLGQTKRKSWIDPSAAW